MPSPVGHFLGGAIVGAFSGVGSRESGVTPPASRDKRLIIACAIAACLPDLDFLWGRHNMETHSLGAAVLAGVAALALTRGRDVRLAVAVTIAWASHTLFDWLGSDDSPPLGVMALWPASYDYYFSHAFVFDAISRQYWRGYFWRHNVLAVVREITMLVPALLLVIWLKRTQTREPQGHEET